MIIKPTAPTYYGRLASLKTRVKPTFSIGVQLILIGAFVMLIPAILGPAECSIKWAIALSLAGGFMVFEGFEIL